jgi:hypothetical protein
MSIALGIKVTVLLKSGLSTPPPNPAPLFPKKPGTMWGGENMKKHRFCELRSQNLCFFNLPSSLGKEVRGMGLRTTTSRKPWY